MNCKTKVSDFMIIVGKSKNPCYSIMYYDLSDNEWHIGFSSYDLSKVINWKNECLEIVEDDKVGTHEIHKAAIEYYGEEAQENQCIEECAELIQAINKKHRGKDNNIPEEIADVEICLEQLKMINQCADEVEKYKAEKTERLKERITR